MACFRLGEDGPTIVAFADDNGRFDMRDLAVPVQATVDRILVSGFLVPCGDDGKSMRTLEQLRYSAMLAGHAEDGTLQNPFILSVAGLKPRKFQATDAITSPSSAAEHCASLFDKHNFYDFRPDRALPLGIYVRAFALVRDVMVMDPQQIDPRAWMFVRQLREEMPASFTGNKGGPEEALRQQAFTYRLRSYISDALGPEFFVISNKEASQYHAPGKGSDVKIYLKFPNGAVLLIASIEVKPEIGFNGEPSVENLIYYAHQVSKNCHQDIYFTGYPMLLMELVGPNLRLAGAYFMDKAVCEPMTPYLSLLQLHDPVHLRSLGCMAMSIVTVLTALKEVYYTAGSRPKALRCEGALFWPYRLQELYPDANLERLFAGKAVFRLQLNTDNKVVKFVQERYGTEAHEQWAKCGYAPDFQLEDLPGSWKMITMSRLGKEDGWLNLDDFKKDQASQWDACKLAVKNALDKVQSETPQMAHGDIRAPNIMCNFMTGKVMFVDFDWAGPSGSVFYPPLLNERIQWPDGAKGNRPILAQHDQDALGLIFY